MSKINDFIEPLPYRFNPWKHHLLWVKKQIECIDKAERITSLDEIFVNIRAINSNNVDLYIGNFSPEKIIQLIDNELQKEGIVNKESFTHWINNWEFKLLNLPDSSTWVIREGKEDERYIHFHPARNSPNAIRIHGNSWKTAIALQLLHPLYPGFSLDLINEMRELHLKLSPIKDLRGSVRLNYALELLK